mmetsp:Transcript_10305/g.19772  ORF Transcript_10305/g.19772 Transcript_10305/m.19772 type:complete len:277 (+) Transcript_10305:182-1012(+)
MGSEFAAVSPAASCKVYQSKYKQANGSCDNVQGIASALSGDSRRDPSTSNQLHTSGANGTFSWTQVCVATLKKTEVQEFFCKYAFAIVEAFVAFTCEGEIPYPQVFVSVTCFHIKVIVRIVGASAIIVTTILIVFTALLDLIIIVVIIKVACIFKIRFIQGRILIVIITCISSICIITIASVASIITVSSISTVFISIAPISTVVAIAIPVVTSISIASVTSGSTTGGTRSATRSTTAGSATATTTTFASFSSMMCVGARLLRAMELPFGINVTGT